MKNMSKMRKLFLVIVALIAVFIFLNTFAALISSKVYKKYLKPEIDHEQSFDEKILNKFSILSEQISSLNALKQAQNSSVQEKTRNYRDHDYLAKYPFFLDCKTNLNKWYANESSNTAIDYEKIDFNILYADPAGVETHEKRIIRAILLYFPIDKQDGFKHELKWLYRSWINMQTFEPTKWRTDLIIFIDYVKTEFDKSDYFLNELNCTFTNIRTSPNDKPMCTLISYKSLKNRNLTKDPQTPDYDFILDQVNIFNDEPKELEKFYSMLYQNLITYNYLDSILMAFEGHKYFKSAGYDFLIRSDMDVFLTPLFAKWIPKHCNDFIVGGGGYSSHFNRKRFKRIAQNLRLNYPNVGGLGSTWYSTPDQFRLVSYLTLFGMAYLSAEEFSQPEREGKVGTILWPDWHYGVLLLYGQNLALNHLIGSNELNIVKLNNLIDYPTANTESVQKKLHLHVYHGDNLFSKFLFSLGRYDNYTVSDYEPNADQIKFYALKMALESKRTLTSDLRKKFNEEIALKKI